MAHIYNTGYAVVDTDPNTISELQSNHNIKIASSQDGNSIWRYVESNSVGSRWVTTLIDKLKPYQANELFVTDTGSTLRIVNDNIYKLTTASYPFTTSNFDTELANNLWEIVLSTKELYFDELIFIDGANPVLTDITLSTTKKEYRLIRSTFFGRTYFVTNSVNDEDFSHSILKINGFPNKIKLKNQVFKFQTSNHPTDLKVWVVGNSFDTQDLVPLNTYEFDFWNTSYKGAVIVLNYDSMPLKEGQYILNNGLAAFSNSYNTDVYDAITGQNILVKDIPIGGGNNPYIVRKIFQDRNSFSYFTDELYDGGDVFVGYIYGSPNRNNFKLELTKHYFSLQFKGNYRFAIIPNEIYTLSFKNEIYTDNNSVKSINAYNNLPFSQKNISVTVNGEDATGAVKVGLLSRNSTISEDFIAFEPNGFWTKERLQGAEVLITFERDKAPARIPTLSKENFTGVNVAVAESENGHGLKMQEVFGNSYGTFTADFRNGIVGDVDDVGFNNLTLSPFIQDALISANADMIFGAARQFNVYPFLRYPEEVFKVFPNGSNNLVRDDNGFTNDTQFITNGVLVTSRADNDLDGSDPKGTSYGFGVEFNEPTLEADMLAGGYNWTGPSFSEHQQSPATAIVAGKLKFIKDQTGAPWYLVREAARQTASQANNYNIYTGFGIIDKAAAITWLSTKDWEVGNKKYALEDSVAPLKLTNSEEFVPDTWNTAKLHFSGGLVTLTGMIRLPNGTTNGSVGVFLIPLKYRPNRSALNMCFASTNNIVRLDIAPSGYGTVRILPGQPQLPSNSWVSLNGCSYMLDGSLIE